MCQPPWNIWQGQTGSGQTGAAGSRPWVGVGGPQLQKRESGAAASVQPGRGLMRRCLRGCPGPSV